MKEAFFKQKPYVFPYVHKISGGRGSRNFEICPAVIFAKDGTDG